MLRPFSLAAALVVAASVTAPSAQAQFDGHEFADACGGDMFFACVNLSVSGQGSSYLIFTVTNLSNGPRGQNANSSFTTIGLGSSGAAPTSMGLLSGSLPVACTNALTGCSNTSKNFANGFNGFGFTGPFYGLDVNGITDGLHPGQTASFFLNFADSTSANGFLNGVQLAIHDQGTPNGCGSLSAKVVFNADGHPTSANAPTCGPGLLSTVPEPSSMALLGTGLFGLVPIIRRRRNK